MRTIHAIWIAPSLPTSPIWNATASVVGSLPPMQNTTRITSAPGCHLPMLDPWNPDILQFVSSRPRLVSFYALTWSTQRTLNSLAVGTHGLTRANAIFIQMISLKSRISNIWQSNQLDVLGKSEVPRLHWHRLTNCQWNCPTRTWSAWKPGADYYTYILYILRLSPGFFSV